MSLSLSGTRARAAAVASCAVVFVAMAAWSWGKWPDPRTDYGEELYVGWRILQGDVLYRDVAHFYGPLSSYAIAGIFWVLGVGLHRLVAVQLALTAGTGWLLSRIGRRAFGPLSALSWPVVFFVCFAFEQYDLVGNFNWICPYRHEAVHGALLGLLGVSLFARSLRTRGRWERVVAGLCVGATVLTKPEMALAAVVAVAVGVALGDRWREARPLVAAVLVPPVVAVVGFRAGGIGWKEAGADALGAFAPLLDRRVLNDPFYAITTGLDRPGEHLGQMALGCLAVVLWAAAVWFVATRLESLGRGKGVAALGALALGGAVGLGARWTTVEHALTPMIAVVAIAFVVRGWRDRRSPEPEPRVLAASFCVYAAALLSKIPLWPKIEGLGFVLALPATLVAVSLATEAFPKLLPERSAWFARAAAVLMVAAFCVRCLRAEGASFARKTLPMGAGADSFWGYDPAFADADLRVKEAMEELQRRSPPDATLAVLPDGVMINYLLRRRNPTPYVQVPAPYLAHYGEEALLAALARSPPDDILFITWDTTESRVGRFGTDDRFGASVARWVRSAYSPAWLSGGDPFTQGAFGIRLFEHRR